MLQEAIFCCFHFPSCIFGFWKHLKRNKMSCHTSDWLTTLRRVFSQSEAALCGFSEPSVRLLCHLLYSVSCMWNILSSGEGWFALSQRENSHLLWTIFRFGIVSIIGHQCHLHFEVLFLRWLPSCCGACQDNHHGHKQSKRSFKDILKAKIKVKRSRLALTTSHSYKLQRWQPADLFASVGNQNKKKKKENRLSISTMEGACIDTNQSNY